MNLEFREAGLKMFRVYLHTHTMMEGNSVPVLPVYCLCVCLQLGIVQFLKIKVFRELFLNYAI